MSTAKGLLPGVQGDVGRDDGRAAPKLPLALLDAPLVVHRRVTRGQLHLLTTTARGVPGQVAQGNRAPHLAALQRRTPQPAHFTQRRKDKN